MNDLWAQLKNLAKEMCPEKIKSLSKGTSTKTLASAQKNLGFDFPADLRDSLLLHDGQPTDELLFHGEWYLLPVAKIVFNYVELDPLLPFAANGAGDFLCLAKPLEEDLPWPVVQYSHEGGRKKTLFPSYKRWFESVVEDFQRLVALENVANEQDFLPLSMDDFLGLVGNTFDDQIRQNRIMANGTQREDLSGTEVFLSNFKKGFEVQLGKNGRVEVVHLYCVGGQEFATFEESLTSKIRRSDGYQQVRKKLGAPTKSGVVEGAPGGWDRFDRENFCIRIGYRKDQPGIKMISIMASDIAP